MHRSLILVLLILSLLSLQVFWACGDDDDDNDNNDDSTADDDDDNDDASPIGDDDDNDTSPAGDDDDDDNDDTTPSGPAPLIDGLNLIPAEGFAGDTITISFHWQDLEGDVQGGQMILYIDGVQAETFTPATAGSNSGYVDQAYILPDTLDVGDLLFQVELADAAGNVSNRLETTFVYYGANTAPVISNLYFEPAPACPETNASFNIVFTYVDQEANLNGGTINIIVDELFTAPLQAIINQDLPATQTIAVGLSPAYLPISVEDGQTVNFSVQLADNQGVGSNLLDADLVFSNAACSAK